MWVYVHSLSCYPIKPKDPDSTTLFVIPLPASKKMNAARAAARKYVR
jgi:hypothetical protein